MAGSRRVALAASIVRPADRRRDFMYSIAIGRWNPRRSPGANRRVAVFPIVVSKNHVPGLRGDQLVGAAVEGLVVDAKDAAPFLAGADARVTSRAGVGLVEEAEVDAELDVFF